jgi:O-antigen ligase
MAASGSSPVRPWIYRVLLYGAFISATFTIAGSEASFILLLATAVSDPLLWRWVRAESPPAPLPYGERNPPAWIGGALLALVGIALVSALVNPGTLESLDDMRYHYRVFLPFALLLALPHTGLRRLFGTCAVFVALFSVYGVIQYRYGVDWLRPEGQKIIRPYADGVFLAAGNFTHHITYGGVWLMLAVFLLALGTARDSGTVRLRALWTASGGLAALGTVASLARSAWLGLLAGLLILALLRLPRRWSAALGSLALLGVAGYAALALSGSWLEERFQDKHTPALVQRLIRTSPQYDVDRVRMWQSGLLAIRDRPWLGAGMGHAGEVLPPYRQIVSERYHYDYMLDAGVGLHDIYLQVAFDLGLPGLAAYLWVWGAIFAWSGKALGALRPGAPAARHPDAGLWRAILQGAVAALAGSTVAGLFENNAYDKEVQGVILLLMGLALYAGLRARAFRG